MVSDVTPQDIMRARGRSSIGPRIGKFRRSIKDVTKDGATDTVLGLCDVHCFRNSDDVEVDQQSSDASGNFEVSVYDDGPFYLKAETPIERNLRFYFHTETTLQGAPAPPAGCLTLSELAPDQTDAAAPSQAGGHLSTSSGVETSLLNKPTTKDETGVAGEAPTVGTPAAAHQFGWFSDVAYSGTFALGSWQFQWREDDNNVGLAGHAVINIYAGTTRDFASMRFLAQIHGGVDWWLGATNAVNSWVSGNVGPFTLTAEYIFIQLWCHETSGFAGGQTLTFNQEGSDLSDATRSWLLSASFENSGITRKAGASDNTLVGV